MTQSTVSLTKHPVLSIAHYKFSNHNHNMLSAGGINIGTHMITHTLNTEL